MSTTVSEGMLQNADVFPRTAVGPNPRPGLQGAYSSRRLDPLGATARPIFAIDPLVFKSDKKSRAISFAIHVAGIALVLALALKVHTSATPQPTTIVTPMDLKIYIPPITLPVAKPMGGGGGGGAHELVEPSKGHAPLVAKIQITPPQIVRIERPKLGVEPTAMLKLPDNSSMPTIGMAQSPQIALASQGSGSGSGFGQGAGGGIGSGSGIGAGPGSGGGYGGGLMSVGGGVSAPQLIHSVDPEFTEEARRANYQGNVSIKLIVDSQGNPQSVRLASHLGMGLEEKALDAVRQYRFRPAMYQGHAVPVQIVIDVAFHLH